MQGVFVKFARCSTKKALKEAAASEPETIELEATSAFGNEYSGPALEMPVGQTAYVVGPDPYTKRNWYANITRRDNRLVIE